MNYFRCHVLLHESHKVWKSRKSYPVIEGLYMSELCNCVFFSSSLGSRKEKQFRPRLNETAQSSSATEAKSKQTALIILYRGSPATAAALCGMCCLPLHCPFANSAFSPRWAALGPSGSLHPGCPRGQRLPPAQRYPTWQET